MLPRKRPRPPDRRDELALAEDDIKHLLPLMDADKNGKVSRQVYMKFMGAEFDSLDKAKTGELDVKARTQSNLCVSHFVAK